MNAPDWTPKAGDIVMDDEPRGGIPRWRALVCVVSRATVSTMWLVGVEKPIRRSRYGWHGWRPATQDVIDAVKARKAWLQSRPATTAIRLRREHKYHLHASETDKYETPSILDVNTAKHATSTALREIAAEAVLLADWLDAEPKESP